MLHDQLMLNIKLLHNQLLRTMWFRLRSANYAGLAPCLIRLRQDYDETPPCCTVAHWAKTVALLL